MMDCGSCMEAGDTNALFLSWIFLYLVSLLLYSFSGLLVSNIHIELWIRFTFGFRKLQNAKFEDRWCHTNWWPIQKTAKTVRGDHQRYDWTILFFLKSKQTIHKNLISYHTISPHTNEIEKMIKVIWNQH